MRSPDRLASPFLQEGGETGALLRARDWEGTTIGPVAGWPQSLKTAVSLMLRTHQPTFIGWGKDLLSFYNDGYIPICGSKHPQALGQPMAMVWREIWDSLSLLNEAVLRGESLRFENQPFDLAGSDEAGPRYFTFAYTPLLDDDGRIGGIFCSAVETTATVKLARTMAREPLPATQRLDVGAGHSAHQVLLERDELLRLATDAADVGLWDSDPSTGWMFWAPRVRAMFGITHDRPLTLDDFYQGVHPDDRDATLAAFAAASDPARRLVYDVQYRTVGRDDSRVRWVAARGRGLFGADGTCRRVIGTAIDITARKDAEQAMEVALEASRTGTFRWNIQNNTLTWDTALDRLFGLVPGQVVRSLDQFVLLVHPDDRAEVIARCERCRTEAADFEMEFRVVYPDGSIHWLYDRGRTSVDAEGRAKTMTGACVDVTQRHEAEAAMRASELFYRRTLESVPGITYTTTADGACDYLSEQWTRHTGQPASESLGAGWLQALHPDDRARAAAAWSRSVREGTRFEVEFRIRGANGGYEWFQSEASMIPADGNAPARWIGGLHNVHQLKQVQSALQERERELRALADNSPDIIARFDRQLRHVFVNAAIERVTGLAAATFIGRTNEELGMPAALCAQWNAAIGTVFQHGRPIEMQFQQRHGGVERHLLSRIVPETGPDGAVEHVLGVTRDITELWQAQEALRDADRQKDDFLATLAHELRNPLAPLRTGLELLKKADGSTNQQRVRDIMDRQLKHMVRLVDDLLDIARISQGKIVLQRDLLQLQAVLDHAIEAARPLLDVHAHQLEWEGADPAWHVHGDLTRLVQAVANLLNNAAKYTPRGGRIAVRARQEQDWLAITVEDNGVGIPQEALQRVFDRFVQVEQHAERAQGGLGIGLSVVKSLVEMHGGRVGAESIGLGCGSRFTIWLPLARPPVPSGADRPAPIEPIAVAPRKVLIVDDNRDAAETLGMIVGMAGHEVQLAYDGASALQVAQQYQPHVIFLDIGMPGMNGYEAAARLRALPGLQDRMLVALTGWGAEEDRAKSLRAGFDLHLTKPVDPRALDSLLAQAAV